MSPHTRLLGASVLLAGVLTAACGSSVATHPPVAVPTAAKPALAAPPVVPPPAPPPDPIDTLIASSQARFDTGYAELQLGHLVRAKAEFNAAIDLLLESPSGARSNRKLQEHFDRLVDRISAFEIRTLAEGDGFAEKPTVPASLDELLAQPTPESPTPKPELSEVVAADLATTSHDIPIPLNAKVLSYIELFQGRLHDWFQISLQRGMAYLPMIQNVFRAQGLPLDLAYIPIVESAFNTNALSRATAVGFWQLMRGTAGPLGLRQDWYVDERSNPEKATLAAAKYLRELRGMFDGDWHLALASYNGGPGYVQRQVKSRGGVDFWTLAARNKPLPRETREYVPMVLASIVIARNPSLYGFTAQPAVPAEYDAVTLPGPVDLRRIAEWTGVDVEDVRRLNPELRRLTTPIFDEAYQLRVPRGTADLVEQRLSEVPIEDLAPLQWYTVKRGESLTTIANKLKVRRADLAEANKLTLKSAVAPGKKLVIPRIPTTVLAAVKADRPEAVVAGTPSAPAAAAAPAATVPAAPETGERVKVTYYVKRGDTLSSIARDFRITVGQIREWNGIQGDHIELGQRLTVYTTRQHVSGTRQ